MRELCFNLLNVQFHFAFTRFFRAFAVRAFAAAFDAFVAISRRFSGVRRLLRAVAPFLPIAEK